MIWVTSDLHLCHNREFIFKPRGFKSIADMNQAILINWNTVVDRDDDVYVLGDLVLSDTETGLVLLKQLNGKLHVIRGNHDTNARIALYKELSNVVDVVDALYLNYKGYHFFMSHFPCICGSLEAEDLKHTTCNLFGHTHQQTNFYNDIPFMYHVGVDSHDCTPIPLDDIIEQMEEKVLECKSLL